MTKKKILIISGESWRDESNGGNVLSNLFQTFTDEYEFAQIFTNPAMPANKICTKYFHISEGEVIKSFLKRQPFGRQLQKQDLLTDSKISINSSNNNNSLLAKLKRLNFPIFHTIQDYIWRFSKWKTPELERFVLDYNPDIIFAPMYYSLFLHRIDRYVAKITRKKMISYVSDDHLTMRHFSLSPVFWYNRLILRRNVIKTSKFYSLLYTMTKEQKDEYEKILNVPMKILKKTGHFSLRHQFKTSLNNPLQIIYGGNLIYNRFKTLAKLASVIKEINHDGIKLQLKIFTQTPLSVKFKNLLHDGTNTFLLGKVTMEELHQQYSNADMVLHVESFDLQQKLLTRLSFSTKIIDLLHSARCIIAICWSESSPYKYLKSEDAAICIANVDDIKDTLLSLIKNEDKIIEYSHKAWECGVRNHNATEIIAALKSDFEMLSN